MQDFYLALNISTGNTPKAWGTRGYAVRSTNYNTHLTRSCKHFYDLDEALFEVEFLHAKATSDSVDAFLKSMKLWKKGPAGAVDIYIYFLNHDTTVQDLYFDTTTWYETILSC